MYVGFCNDQKSLKKLCLQNLVRFGTIKHTLFMENKRHTQIHYKRAAHIHKAYKMNPQRKITEVASSDK